MHWKRVDGRSVSLRSGLSMDMRIAVAHIHCQCAVRCCWCFIEENENWIRMHQQSLLASQSHKGKSFKTAFVWMHANLPILSAALQTHTHIQSNIAVAFWNASFIHIVLPNQISRLHWIFMKVHCMASHWIGLDFAIDTILKSVNSHMNLFAFDALTTFCTHYCQLDLTHSLLPFTLRLPHTLRYCFMFPVYAKMHTCHMLTQTLCGDCIDFEWELTSTLVVCVCIMWFVSASFHRQC